MDSAGLRKILDVEPSISQSTTLEIEVQSDAFAKEMYYLRGGSKHIFSPFVKLALAVLGVLLAIIGAYCLGRLK